MIGNKLHSISQWESKALKQQKKSEEDLNTFFMPTSIRDHKNIKRIVIPLWLFKLPPRQEGQSGLSGSIFWCQLALPLKSHRGILTSLIFLYSSHKSGIENVFKTSSDFFHYFNASDSHCVRSIKRFSKVIEKNDDGLLFREHPHMTSDFRVGRQVRLHLILLNRLIQ